MKCYYHEAKVYNYHNVTANTKIYENLITYFSALYYFLVPIFLKQLLNFGEFYNNDL